MKWGRSTINWGQGETYWIAAWDGWRVSARWIYNYDWPGDIWVRGGIHVADSVVYGRLFKIATEIAWIIREVACMQYVRRTHVCDVHTAIGETLSRHMFRNRLSRGRNQKRHSFNRQNASLNPEEKSFIGCSYGSNFRLSVFARVVVQTRTYRLIYIYTICNYTSVIESNTCHILHKSWFLPQP